MNIDQLLKEWRDETLAKLDEQLDQLFDASADVMLEYAEKAQSNHVQGRFYEALREIRLRRVQVSEHFHSGLQRVIFRFDTARPAVAVGSDDVLSLVDPEDFERGLAMATITEGIERDHQLMFRALSKRLAAISGRRPLELADLPAGPRQLATQFAASTALLQIEHEARLALYTLFERFVLKHVPESLNTLNNRLAAVGVLPDLKTYPSLPKRESGDTRDRPTSETREGQPGATAGQGAQAAGAQQAASTGSSGSTPLGDEVLLRIRDLLAARRAKRHPGGAGPAVPPAPVSEVVDAIGSLPGSPVPAPAVQAARLAPRVSHRDLQGVRQSLSSQRDRVREQIGEERVAPDVDDVIEIVGALFEMMLNEDGLPNAVKALLSHLHTPFLKYAVTDPTLLEDVEHPARRWLDDMIRAGSEWVDPADLNKGIYPDMSKAVLKLINEPKLSRNQFEQVRQQFAEAVKQIQRKQRNMEQRASEHAKGKARLEYAQQLVQEQLARLLDQHPGAEAAESFLRETWADYLALLLLRSENRADTPESRAAIKLGERLCEVAARTAQRGTPDLERLDELQASLDAHIGDLIPHLRPRIARFIQHLKSGEATVGGATAARRDTPISSSAAARGESEPLTPEETKIAASLSQLPAGTRFWRKSPDGEQETTIRLVWFNPQTTKFMFVDLAGQQAGMVPIKELASDVAQGRARVLEDHRESFVERALGAFQTLLKQKLSPQ